MEYTKLKESIFTIVKETGLLMTSQQNIEIHEKEGHANYVTNMDIACQSYIIKQLAPLLEANFIAEEDNNAKSWKHDHTWIIDPIDGTTNYAKNYQHSCISIALAHHDQIVIGIVHNPYLNETFHAIKGQGAYCNETPIHVSNLPSKHALVSFGTTPYDLASADKTFDTAKALFLQTADVRRSGSAALDLCYVACGRTDGFFEYRLSPWDYAAASLIIQEANGFIDGLEQAFTLHHPIGIIAGSPNTFPLIRECTRNK